MVDKGVSERVARVDLGQVAVLDMEVCQHEMMGLAMVRWKCWTWKCQDEWKGLAVCRGRWRTCVCQVEWLGLALGRRRWRTHVPGGMAGLGHR